MRRNGQSPISRRIIKNLSFWVPKQSKKAIKIWLRKQRLAYALRWHSFTSRDLVDQLRSLGVKPGDVLMVHSSFDRFEGFLGGPREVILALQEVVTRKGTILMPTMPFAGTALEYLSTTRVSDLARVPSRMGLITEVFRRSPGVVRSIHPTHPTACWGANAEKIACDHYLATTPCGRESPFGRLLDFNGKILLLGTKVSSITFFHTIEEILESEFPMSPFTQETFSLRSRDKDGNIRVTNTRLYDTEFSLRRNPFKLVSVLRKQGQWKEERVGKLSITVLKAQDILEASLSLARRGVYAYDFEKE